MTLRKVGRFFWLDIYVGGKRVRRSLKTGNKFEALDQDKEVKDKLLAEHRGGDVKFADFAKKYLDWACSSKPAAADRDVRLEKRADLVTLGSLPGHSKTMTSLIYPHTDNEKDRKAISLI
jgi:hypothetical protein